MTNNNVFMKQDDQGNIVVTKTDVLETIPKGSTEMPLKNWRDTKNKEWRWRFLKLPEKRHVVEISFIEATSTQRIFFNKYGNWVPDNIDPVYDNYVIKEYYYYS